MHPIHPDRLSEIIESKRATPDEVDALARFARAHVTLDRPELAPRQNDVRQFIVQYRSDNGYSPTLQEVGDALGITKVSVFEHVDALIRKGWMKRCGTTRNLMPV